MHFSHLTLLPVHSKRYITLLKKMAESGIDNLISGGYDAP